METFLLYAICLNICFIIPSQWRSPCQYYQGLFRILFILSCIDLKNNKNKLFLLCIITENTYDFKDVKIKFFIKINIDICICS